MSHIPPMIVMEFSQLQTAVCMAVLGYCPPGLPTFNELGATADDELFQQRCPTIEPIRPTAHTITTTIHHITTL